MRQVQCEIERLHRLTKRQRNISLYQTFLQLFCPNNLYCVEWGVKLYSLTHWNKLPADNVLSDSESGFKLRLKDVSFQQPDSPPCASEALDIRRYINRILTTIIFFTI